MKPSLLLFAKPPRMGLSKTRLARDLDPATAQRIARMTMARTLRAATDPRWRLTLYTAPDRHLGDTLGGLWPLALPRRSQGHGDLGDRLTRAYREAPIGPVIFIGADCPDITPKLLWRACRSLIHRDAVIGPADDGGFWLLGLNKQPRRPPPFAGVRWSTSNTLQDVLRNLSDQTSYAVLPTLLDVDLGADWTRWQAHKSH